MQILMKNVLLLLTLVTCLALNDFAQNNPNENPNKVGVSGYTTRSGSTLWEDCSKFYSVW